VREKRSSTVQRVKIPESAVKTEKRETVKFQERKEAGRQDPVQDPVQRKSIVVRHSPSRTEDEVRGNLWCSESLLPNSVERGELQRQEKLPKFQNAKQREEKETKREKRQEYVLHAENDMHYREVTQGENERNVCRCRG